MNGHSQGRAPAIKGVLKQLAPALDRLDGGLRRQPTPSRAAPRPRDSDVSVVVQGAVAGRPDDAAEHRWTQRCIHSVRNVLPQAEVVLSTWRGSDVRGLAVDRIVVNDDPGPTPSRDVTHVVNNINRQVVTTRAGLEQVARPLALKLRTDMELQHDGFLDLLHGWPARSDAVRVLRDRVVAPTFYSFNPRRTYARFPYMVSDWCHFGRRDDLLDLWSAPHWDTSFEWLLGRGIVASEQWIWMSLLNRHDEGASFARRDVVEHSELSIANNTVLVEPGDFGVHMLKFTPHLGHQVGVYTHGEWLRLYTRHCLGRELAGWDRQALLRAVVDRVWVRGLARPLIGYPEDMVPSPSPAVPPLTPNQPVVLEGPT